MAANPRPPRRKASRPVTRRVAGRPHASGGPTQPAPPADGNLESADNNPVAADSNPVAADSNPVAADSTAVVVDSGTQSVEDDALSTGASAQSTGVSAHSTGESAQSTETDAHSTETDAQSTETDAQSTGETPKPAGKSRPVARVSTLRPANEAPAPAPGRPSRSDASRGSPSVFPFGKTTLVVLGAVAGVLAVFALIAGLHPGAKIGPNKAFIDQAGTTQLTSQASTKLCLANSADATSVQNFDAWAAKTKDVLTGKALTQFNDLIKAQKDALTQVKAKNDCRMDALGVQHMAGSDDGATAQLVASMIVSGSQNGVVTQSISPRYQVNMVKRGDQWLIADVLDL
ncbi:hypothetical protein ACWDTI_16140 [Gordonia sp. NPDC003424]